MSAGYWNGLPTQIRRCTGVVVEHDPGKHAVHAWWKGLAGQRVRAVEVQLDGVNYGGGVIYLMDDEYTTPAVPEMAEIFPALAEARTHPTGEGWRKVTEGRGGPDYPHADLDLVDVEYLDD